MVFGMVSSGERRLGAVDEDFGVAEGARDVVCHSAFSRISHARSVHPAPPSPAFDRVLERGSVDPDRARDVVRWVADRAPAADVTLLAALGAIARHRSELALGGVAAARPRGR